MKTVPINPHYRMGIANSLSAIGQNQWNQLLERCDEKNPFLSYAFFEALHQSGSASAETGWEPHFICIWENDRLAAACPMYRKYHSYGEYVFDWAWADAYERHGHEYYPKLLSAIPFTPVSCSRILSSSADTAALLVAAIRQLAGSEALSSCHILFPPEEQITALESAGFLIRSGVQFHWLNRGYQHFDDFLADLTMKKRKNIRSERKKVLDAGIRFRHVSGRDASESDWLFFKRCYDLTYRAHRSTPYLNTAFFLQIAATMQEQTHLIIAERDQHPIAASLLFHNDTRVFGRYWGCIEPVSCLHFETAYYQAIEFCIREKFQVFEGGAQGEHKMARGFLPHPTWSAHWLEQTQFRDAVERFLERETVGVAGYMDELNEHSPYKQR